ncbi:MAG: DNA-3-methyladenine glycosylase family protein [Tissierella sp.]|uniref:DNA-3-methyladenine glycosylase family protein n=1 Tax=Tissierella sp. TaxID=41274 RepID=UPI003F971A4C
MEKYKLLEKDNKIILKNIENFHPKHIFECGQAFRWYKEEDGSYTTISYGRVLNVKKEGKDVILYPTNKEEFEKIWMHYFDLERDYSSIKKELSKDPILKEAIGFGDGIRVLNQEPFEIVISFIISANNQIPRIKKSIETISLNYGKKIDTKLKGKDYYSFPSPKELADAELEEFNKITKVGFRGKRVLATSKIIEKGELELQAIFHMNRDDGKEALMTLPGVGPKVSDCILLFAFDKDEAFPVDVWVKRVMEYFYLKEDTNVKHIGEHGKRIFGSLAGFAQQYLFYYAREKGIGK